jgi:hypothetical protein
MLLKVQKTYNKKAKIYNKKAEIINQIKMYLRE